MNDFFMNAVAENRCPYCAKGLVHGTDMMGIRERVDPCGHCGGSGLPNEDIRRRARLEEKGSCDRCEMPMKDHDSQYAQAETCIRALSKAVRELQSRVG